MRGQPEGQDAGAENLPCLKTILRGVRFVNYAIAQEKSFFEKSMYIRIDSRTLFFKGHIFTAALF
jgi:hypothetical protein